MPSEKQMWDVLRLSMSRAALDPVRVENSAMPGTPDVNYTGGWIELKHADRWPLRGGPLRLAHPPTTEQKVWLYRRSRAGGNAFLLLRVGREWFLFEGMHVQEVWRTPPTQLDIRKAALTFNHPDEVAGWLAEMSRDGE